MARSARKEYDRFIWGHWNPETSSSIYLQNEAYHRLQNELSSLRNSPKLADPKRLLDLLSQMQQTWNLERQQYQKTIDSILTECQNEFKKFSDEVQLRYSGLAEELNRLQKQLERQRECQKQLEHDIQRINREADRDKKVAERYCRAAHEQFLTIKDDPCWIKYNLQVLNEIILMVSQFNAEQPSATLQAAASSVLCKIEAGKSVVEKKHFEYLDEHTKAIGQIERALQQIDHYENDLFFDSDCKTPQNKVDINHWTYDEFSRIAHYIRKELCPRMKDSTTLPGYMIENLKKDREELSERMKQLEKLVRDAIIAGQNSKRRNLLAYMAADVLKEQYYYLLTLDGYDDGDDRLGYVIYMYSTALNTSLRLILNPVSGASSIQTILSYRFSNYIDHGLEEVLYNDIRKTLESLGIRLDNPHNIDDILELDIAEIEHMNNEIHLPKYLKAANS